MSLPETLRFEKLGSKPGGAECFYRKIAHRAPLKGEYYVSGAEPMAYLAPNDLTSPYLIVVPTNYTTTAKVRGLKVNL